MVRRCRVTQGCWVTRVTTSRASVSVPDQHPMPPALSKVTLGPVVSEAHTLSLAPCSTHLTAGTTASMWSWPRGQSHQNGWQRGHRGMDRARSPTAGQRRHCPSPQSSRNSCAVGWQPSSRCVHDTFVPLRTENWSHITMCPCQGTGGAQASPAVGRGHLSLQLLPPGLWREWAQPQASALILAQGKDLQRGRCSSNRGSVFL